MTAVLLAMRARCSHVYGDGSLAPNGLTVEVSKMVDDDELAEAARLFADQFAANLEMPQDVEPRNANAEDLQFPHCDPTVLHAPGECEYCDRHPDWQRLRQGWRINFTGGSDMTMVPCPSSHFRPVLRQASGRVDALSLRVEREQRESAIRAYQIEQKRLQCNYEFAIRAANHKLGETERELERVRRLLATYRAKKAKKRAAR